MGDRNTDHLHRNIAALTEFFEDHGVVVADVETDEDTWASDRVEFTIIVPQFDPIMIEE